jgi:amidase
VTGFLEDPSLDGLALAGLVRSGAVTAEELLDESLRTIARLNSSLNAVVRTMEDDARRAIARGLPPGPFTGVPLLLKDLMSGCAGVPLASGSRFLREFISASDCELVRRYRTAGFVLAGKTNTPEFGLTPTTEPDLFGPTRNPWDPSRTAGGSSGGSAAAVASGMVPIAHGGDGGGSIRIPASCCGLFGLKPTRGRTPSGPAIGES